jgi:alpha-glucosidase
MLLLTLRGTPTIYYGDEIGMEQVSIPEHRIRDPLEKNIPGRGLGRDGCRTPMQWDGGTYAGFSTVEPWPPLPENARTHNVETERAETTSLYNLYRSLIALRRSRRALSTGTYKPLKATGDLLLFIRVDNADRILVALNFGGDPISMSFPPGLLSGHFLISSAGDRDNEQVIGSIDLRHDHLSFLQDVMPAEAFSIVQDQIARVIAKGQAGLSLGFAVGLLLAP